jgi:hypothetical protein
MLNLEKIESIQIGNLNDLLSNLLEIPINITELIVKERFMSPYITFESQDLTEHTGILKNTYESFKLEAFSSHFTTDKNDLDLYWVSIYFSFTYKSGGSNGHVFRNVFYNFETKQWFTYS